MYIFCKIHQSNYSENDGCKLWNENDIEYKAKNNCLPAKNHPLYKKVIRYRQIKLKRLTK